MTSWVTHFEIITKLDFVHLRSAPQGTRKYRWIDSGILFACHVQHATSKNSPRHVTGADDSERLPLKRWPHFLYEVQLRHHPRLIAPGRALLIKPRQRPYGRPLRSGFSRLNGIGATFRTSSQERYGEPASPALAKSQRRTFLPPSPGNRARSIG